MTVARFPPSKFDGFPLLRLLLGAFVNKQKKHNDKIRNKNRVKIATSVAPTRLDELTVLRALQPAFLRRLIVIPFHLSPPSHPNHFQLQQQQQPQKYNFERSLVIVTGRSS